MPAIPTEAPASRWRRLAWFVAIWAASVAAVFGAVTLMKALLPG